MKRKYSWSVLDTAISNVTWKQMLEGKYFTHFTQLLNLNFLVQLRPPELFISDGKERQKRKADII